MLGLPQTTVFNRKIKKEIFYAQKIFVPKLKARLQDDVAAIWWRHKLARTTLSLGEGVRVKEIHVLEVMTRTGDIDKNLLTTINRMIPYNILFAVTCGEKAQLWIEAEGVFYHTGWQELVDYSLTLVGMNLEQIYENLVREIAGPRLNPDLELEVAIGEEREQAALTKQIAALENKIKKERQFNKKVALNTELKTLYRQLKK